AGRLTAYVTEPDRLGAAEPRTRPTTARPSPRASRAHAPTRSPGSAARSFGRSPPASCGPPCDGPAAPRGCSADPHVRDHREVVGGVEPADPVRVDLGPGRADPAARQNPVEPPPARPRRMPAPQRPVRPPALPRRRPRVPEGV